jgi:hypothetical protein
LLEFAVETKTGDSSSEKYSICVISRHELREETKDDNENIKEYS